MSDWDLVHDDAPAARGRDTEAEAERLLLEVGTDAVRLNVERREYTRLHVRLEVGVALMELDFEQLFSLVAVELLAIEPVSDDGIREIDRIREVEVVAVLDFDDDPGVFVKLNKLGVCDPLNDPTTSTNTSCIPQALEFLTTSAASEETRVEAAATTLRAP